MSGSTAQAVDLIAGGTDQWHMSDQPGAAEPAVGGVCDAERLHALSRCLLQATDFPQLLERLLYAVVAFEEADFGMIQLPDSQTGQLYTATQRGFSALLPQGHRAAATDEQSISELAFLGRSRIVVEDLSCHAAPHLRRFAADAGFCSAQSAPIIEYDGIAIGTLTTFFRSAHWATAREARLSDLYLRAAGDVICHFREKEALRGARDAAERASEAKSRTLAALSHDLRQPLQALTLLTSALRKLSKDAGLTEALKEQERAIGAASGLLNSLLDLHKLESGSRQPSFDDFGSAELLDEVRTEFAESAARKGLRLQFETCGESARSDRILVGQILRNLVSNAIRYTAVGCVRVRCSPEGDNLRLEVIDTGIGIPADAVPHIFDEFYQVSDAAGREGHGIGLSIAHRIARLLDLEIGVRSKLGNGSIFTLVLPRGCGPLC